MANGGGRVGVEERDVKELFSPQCKEYYRVVLCHVQEGVVGCYVTVFVVGNPSSVSRFEQHITTAVVGNADSG